MQSPLLLPPFITWMAWSLPHPLLLPLHLREGEAYRKGWCKSQSRKRKGQSATLHPRIHGHGGNTARNPSKVPLIPEDTTGVAVTRGVLQENKLKEAAWTPPCSSLLTPPTTTTPHRFLKTITITITTTTTTTTILPPPLLQNPSSTNPNRSSRSNRRRSLRTSWVGWARWMPLRRRRQRSSRVLYSRATMLTLPRCSCRWGRRMSRCLPTSESCRSARWCSGVGHWRRQRSGGGGVGPQAEMLSSVTFFIPSSRITQKHKGYVVSFCCHILYFIYIICLHILLF